MPREPDSIQLRQQKVPRWCILKAAAQGQISQNETGSRRCTTRYRWPAWPGAISRTVAGQGGGLVDGGARRARRKRQRRRVLAGAEDLLVELFPRFEAVAHMSVRPQTERFHGLPQGAATLGQLVI